MSLRAWLDRLAETVRTPAERAEEAERTRQILEERTGRDPAASDVGADAALARRISETTSTRPNYSPFKPVTNNVNASALTVRP
ncbi:hypothetical protein ABDE16_21155 [Streptomyces sp. BRB040]|uniref:hypothetical protein n=1 Tax=Streptomyces sp. BRB040 TaxID=3142634 RepID=UPI0031F6F1DA